MYPEDYKVDIIVPTADISVWPAKQSLEWNKRKSRKNNVRFIPIESSGPNFSFSKSVNIGINESREDADIFLLNDDCFMDSFFIEMLWGAKLGHPECGIFGSLLRFPDTLDMLNNYGLDSMSLQVATNMFSGRKALNHWKPEYQHAGGYIPLTMREQLAGLVRFGFWNLSPFFVIRQVIKTPDMGFAFPGHYHNLNPSNKIHLITAAAMLITRKAFDELGYFDQQLPLSFNDTDYSLRAIQEGIGLCLVNKCTGVHYESLTTRPLEPRKRNDYRTFYNKWPQAKIKSVLSKTQSAIVHPKYCRCGGWVE